MANNLSPKTKEQTKFRAMICTFPIDYIFRYILELSFKNKIVRVYFWIIVPAAILNIFLILFTNVPSIITSLFSVVTLVGFFVWLIIYLRKQKNKQNSEQ